MKNILISIAMLSSLTFSGCAMYGKRGCCKDKPKCCQEKSECQGHKQGEACKDGSCEMKK
ncbi:MAG: hypothetical protein ACK5Y2_09760 [Bdellovibrionales bacterium]